MKDLSNKKLFKQVIIVVGGQGARTGLGFIAIILAARILSVEDFGLFSIFLSTVALGTELTGKSMDWALVRFASRHLETARQKAYLYFKTVLKIRVVVSVVLVLLAYTLSGYIARDIFHKPEYEGPLLSASLGTVAMSLWWFTAAVAQTKEKFVLHAIMNCSNGIFKVIAVVSMLYLGIHSLDTFLEIYVVSFFATLLVGAILIPKNFLKAHEPGVKVASEILHFSKWTLAANVLFSIQAQAGIYFLGYYENATSVGKFSSAWNLVFGLDIMVLALITVLLPKVSKIQGKEDLTHYIKKSLLISLPFCLLSLPFIIYADPFIVLIYSDKFADVGPIFQILFLGAILSLPAQPISLVLLSMNEPKYFAYVEIVVLILTCIGFVIVIPQYSMIGAAMVTLAMRVVQGVLIVGVSFFMVNRPKNVLPFAEESL